MLILARERRIANHGRTVRADVVSPSRLDGTDWDYTTHCAFHAKGGRIAAYDERRYGVFNIGALPSRMKPRDPCLQLPGAQQWVN